MKVFLIPFYDFVREPNKLIVKMKKKDMIMANFADWSYDELHNKAAKKEIMIFDNN